MKNIYILALLLPIILCDPLSVAQLPDGSTILAHTTLGDNDDERYAAYTKITYTPEIKTKSRRVQLEGREQLNDMPTVAECSNGNYVMTWHSSNVFSQAFKQNGEPIGKQVKFETQTSLPYSAVACISDDKYVMVWVDQNTLVHGAKIVFSIFNMDGSIHAKAVEANPDQSNNYYDHFPSVASTSDGSFMMCWFRVQPSLSQTKNGHTCRVFDSDGKPKGSEIHMLETSLVITSPPMMTALRKANKFVLVSKASGTEILLTIFDSNGSFIVKKKSVVSGLSTYRIQVVATTEEKFYISWIRSAATNNDLYYTYFNSDGNAEYSSYKTISQLPMQSGFGIIPDYPLFVSRTANTADWVLYCKDKNEKARIPARIKDTIQVDMVEYRNKSSKMKKVGAILGGIIGGIAIFWLIRYGIKKYRLKSVKTTSDKGNKSKIDSKNIQKLDKLSAEQANNQNTPQIQMEHRKVSGSSSFTVGSGTTVNTATVNVAPQTHHQSMTKNKAVFSAQDNFKHKIPFEDEQDRDEGQVRNNNRPVELKNTIPEPQGAECLSPSERNPEVNSCFSISEIESKQQLNPDNITSGQIPDMNSGLTLSMSEIDPKQKLTQKAGLEQYMKSTEKLLQDDDEEEEVDEEEEQKKQEGKKSQEQVDEYDDEDDGGNNNKIVEASPGEESHENSLAVREGEIKLEIDSDEEEDDDYEQGNEDYQKRE